MKSLPTKVTHGEEAICKVRGVSAIVYALAKSSRQLLRFVNFTYVWGLRIQLCFIGQCTRVASPWSTCRVCLQACMSFICNGVTLWVCTSLVPDHLTLACSEQLGSYSSQKGNQICPIYRAPTKPLSSNLLSGCWLTWLPAGPVYPRLQFFQLWTKLHVQSCGKANKQMNHKMSPNSQCNPTASQVACFIWALNSGSWYYI